MELYGTGISYIVLWIHTPYLLWDQFMIDFDRFWGFARRFTKRQVMHPLSLNFSATELTQM